MGLFDFIFGKKKLTLEKADKLNDKFLQENLNSLNDEDDLIKQVSKYEKILNKK